ncbi:hypothetical protein M8J75_011738 [Diaphorina citri]|nr:hypothetical protein M8J75_011738 [Diaphorina citri]
MKRQNSQPQQNQQQVYRQEEMTQQRAFVQQRNEQSQIQTTSTQQQSLRRVEQHVQVVPQLTQTHYQPVQQQQLPTGPLPGGGSPPVFEQVFKNSRFAQGGTAAFEGRVRGVPKPTISWTRKGAPLPNSSKHQMSYDPQSGNVGLVIDSIGPGDEGEYTCCARNEFGEAICAVFIQPECVNVPLYQQRMQQMQQHRSEKTAYSNGSQSIVSEDFKVDTFEYRLLREVSYRETITRRYVGETDTIINTKPGPGPVSPPFIAQKPRNSKQTEGNDATFVATINGNPKPRLTWFKNGQRLVPSQKYQINYTNQQASLKISQVTADDTGHYTLLAENPQGCVVSSAYLAVEGDNIYEREVNRQTQMLQESLATQAPAPVPEGKMLAPNFARVPADREVTEGKMTRFDVRVTGKPYPDVSWYINGRPVLDDSTHKTLVNESGNHSLMITAVDRQDGGVMTCVARNKAGETSCQCNLTVIEKELVVAPKFVERFTTVTVNEGEPVVLNARAVGTPIPRITWQKDGVQIQSGVGMNITVDGGATTLDLPRARASDGGWYQVTAQNMAGSTATRARLFVQKPQYQETPQDRRLNLPRPTRVIEPEPEPGPEVIYLRHVERAKPRGPRQEQERLYPPPQFIIPLSDIEQVEGGKIHFEARIEPVGDPSMRVDWFINGRPLPASSRATTTFKFGFISLDLLSIVLHDSGEYTVRVTNNSGSAESTALLSVQGRDVIDKRSQYPDSLKYIEQLEDYSKYQRTDSQDSDAANAQRPTFIRPLHDLGQLEEGRNAHFEGQLTPVSDPTMKVEWFKDGRPITASSRTTTIFNFGYVSLNILHLRTEDSGVYTVRAVNRWGEAISQSSIQVITRSSVTGDLGIPEQQRYIEQVEALEAYQQQSQARTPVYEPPESLAPPVFKSPIKDQINIKEGGFAHFETRLEPVNDPTLQVVWLKDGKPVEASSRITWFCNFGYVSLTIKQITTFDQGTYTCHAYNQLGEASTSAKLTVLGKKDIVYDSQYPVGLEQIQYLEDSSRYKRKQEEEVKITQKPRFLGPLKGTNKIVEGQRAHFETRVEPLNDNTMKIEWYHNGKVLNVANRIQTYFDFGYVALDIMSVTALDAGTYTVVARNALGEEQLSATMEIETRAAIDTTSMHRGTYEKTKHLDKRAHVEPTYNIEEISKSKPVFVQPLQEPAPVHEGQNIHLECHLEPMGDPTMRVEWFQNGRPVTVGSRFRTYFDFGYVALDIIHVTAADSGEYTVRATNHLGSAHTSAGVRVISQSDILTDTQNESALEQIQYLEDSSRYQHVGKEETQILAAPQFTKPLHNIETVEGTNIHLECRLQPVGDSTMKVDWLVNGKPVKTGHRFRPAHDFDYVALDLLSVYPEDSGVYTCLARNQLGEAVTSSSVKIMAKRDLILESQHPGGLEKLQYLEDSSRYKKSETIDEIVNIKPRFLTKPKSIENLRERGHAHFECKLEPVTDSNLKVEWFKNGRPVTIGHRFRPIHDFGYVALDIIDTIPEDSGTYTCRAVNLVGFAEVQATLQCRGSAGILTSTQNETGLEQIQYLEDKSKYQRGEYIEETTTQAPIFTTSLKNCEIKEGQRAHFECRLIPVSDNTMKVEWFHNNVPIKSGSRFTETNNFGFVALDIMQCLPEDSGVYTCRAVNALGQAVTSGNLLVHSKKSIQTETQHGESLSRLQQLEQGRYQRTSIIEDTVSQAPVFTQPMRDIHVAENQAAHFEARLIPVGDSKLKVTWLRNGVPIQASNRVSTMHDFGYVALNFKYTYPEDSGTYTCRAVNELGEAVTSSTLFVESKASLQLDTQNEAALQKIQNLEDTSRFKRKEEEEVETGHRFRTTYDFGFASMDILTVYGEDSGEYSVRATNKLGQAVSALKVNVKSKSSIVTETQHEGALKKIQYLEDDSRYKKQVQEDVAISEKPQFGKPLKSVENLPEGQMAHLEATLTPVNDPTMKVEWFCNGKPIPQGHRFKTTYDFGFVALDILYAYAEDSGTYMCRAKNSVGEAVTTCSVSVISNAGLQLGTLDEDRLKKIRELEAYERPKPAPVEDVGQKPVFITPLNSCEGLKEGDHAHLECRVEPVNDANLKIEWFVNGVAIKTGHRFKTTHDFGYVALDILYTYAEDSGTYMCKASNLLGEAVNTSLVTVQSRKNIYLEPHNPDALEKIRELEAQGHPARLEVEEPIEIPPTLTDLRGTTEVLEGHTAHFECQVEPLHDPCLRIDFFHNGYPLPSASRFHITFDFGYVSLDISKAVAADEGEYMVRAVNLYGEAESVIQLKVIGEGTIITDTQHPKGLEKIRKLEDTEPHKRPEVDDNATKQRPVFTKPLQNIDAVEEGKNAHFSCRLIPVGDPTLKVEWFRNEKPLEDSSRITTKHDFGYVAMDLSHVRAEDEGIYICKATNALGEAVTTASMKIKTKAGLQLETQHPEGLKKIQELEQPASPMPQEPERQYEKPIFTQLLTGTSEIMEGQSAHYDCRVVPVGDPTMRFEWFVNGVELKMGSRFHVQHDFGYVTLDITKCVPADSGVYMCKAINRAGEAVSSTSLKVKSKSDIVSESLQPDAWKKIQLKEAEMNKVPEMFIDTRPQQAPVFTTHLENQHQLQEAQHVHLEAQVEPRADPNLKIEWFKNGVPLSLGSRIRSTFDFGLVTLSINSLRADDSAIYTCKATNLLGEAVSTCTLKIEDRHWLLNKSLRPDALPLIEDLEKPKEVRKDEPELVFDSPVFISHLNDVECKENENVHFDCQWFVNNKPLPAGAKFKTTHDFGYVALDIVGAYAEDSGIYTVKATNSKGSATTSGTLKCLGQKDIYLETQHPMGAAGLEKVQEVEHALAGKYQRQPSGPEETFAKPVFIVPLKPEFKLGEAQPLHLEAQVEPKNDPNLKIEWIFNGKPLELGSRFKTTADFGFVTLDLTEVYDRDQGIYTCRAWNLAGETFTSTTIYCSTKESLIERTQHPKGEEGLEKIQDLEESLRRQPAGVPDSEDGRPPQFTSEFQHLSNLSEGEIAHFEASLIPVGDQTMTVEFLYNGKPIEASHRIRTVHAFGMVVLEILGTKIEDTGVYTCRATNKWGQAEISVNLECVDKSKGQPPKFTSHIKSLEGLKDGDSAHFECTLTPVNDPELKVEWFHNGKPIFHKNRVKMVSDFGFVVMDIAYVQSHDSGEYVCRAWNKYGEDFTRATIKCFGKGGVYLDSLQPESLARIRELENAQGQQPVAQAAPVAEAPKFITQISDVTQLKEGQSAHFEARLTPVTDPDLVVEWFYNGKKLPHGHRYRTFHDFGIVILDILYCYEENSGVYECRATNKYGSDVTKASLKCVSKTNLILESQLPEGMEGGLEKIQTLEDAAHLRRTETADIEHRQAPVFTVPLSNIDDLREGENAHFEARLTPTDDPKLKVEWFWNGKPMKTGSRFRTFCDFGFVILEISPVYPEDCGQYSCRAYNDYGEAVTSASMKVQGKRSIILESQLPKGMEGTIDKIAELEGYGHEREDRIEEDLGKAPEFLTTPTDLTLAESTLAHFECRLTPTNDPSMTVEWFHNGKALSAGSRIKTINDFGFVILEINDVYLRDSGLYTCKATNKHGEATTSCKLTVKGRQGIDVEPQVSAIFANATKNIQKLEEALYRKDELIPDEEKPNPPVFTSQLQDNLDVPEAGKVHFDCRLEPKSDPTMRIDWFFNGRPFATGSRVKTVYDFGFISLDMDYVYARDSGEYICRATNKWGTAMTKAKVICKAKHDIVTESQLPDSMSAEKLKELEKNYTPEEIEEDEIPEEPPRFITEIESVTVQEAEPVRFETRVEPRVDPRLRVEWYRNGKPLPSGSRYHPIFDLGFVSLDIDYVYPEDQGEYVCRAYNDHGEAFTKATISCKKIPTIQLQNQVPKGMLKTEALIQMEAAIKKYTSEIYLTEDDLYEPEKKQPPRFVTQIKTQDQLVEMQSTKFECQLAPVGDPNMKVEWFLNGKPLPHKNRFNPIYDFGYVAMNFGWVYPEDSGEYLCRATNLYGMDETRAILKTTGKPGIIYESQLPKGMKSIEKIREMEASWQHTPEQLVEDEKPKEAPVFVSQPEAQKVQEGEPARFCTRVTGYPRPRVMWLINGHTIVNGMRYKLTYDGMWHLDIPKTRQYDNGEVEVIARNSSGEARIKTNLTVTSRHDDYRGVLKNSPRPWYDSELSEYQKERANESTELEKVFDERHAAQATKTPDALMAGTIADMIKRDKIQKKEPEWTQAVKTRKTEDYYNKLSKLEEDQLIREARIREASHQVGIPQERVSVSSKAAQKYERDLEAAKKEPELQPWQKKNILKSRTASTDRSGVSTEETKIIDGRKVSVPEPSASGVHGKEIHTAKSQQVQKEKKGDKEIVRKITATETTEMEHKGKIQERVVDASEKPAKPPVFTKKIQPCRAFEQDQARFEVEFDGDPLPTIKWFREDFPITSSPDFQIHTFSTKSILIMRQVFMEDSGVFAVIAENRGGKAKCSANLVVEEKRQGGRGGVVPPSFLTTISSAVINVGQLARFDAKISATKPLDVYWLKNGKKIIPDIRYKTLEEDNLFTLLIIEAVVEDSGAYECVAMNNAGEARCEAELVVQSKKAPGKQAPAPGAAVAQDEAPTVAEPLKDQNVKEGSAVTLKCRVTGKPPINIKWQKGDKIIKPSKYFQMSKEGDSYVLRISEAFPEDEGQYKCIATNQGGQVVLTANLKVLAPEIQEVLPKVTPLKDIVVNEGQPAAFRAQVTGKPVPKVSWYREGALIPTSPDFQMSFEGTTASLVLNTTYEEDSGLFTLRAVNSAGQVESTARLTVKSKD